jgi:hypothetical protein
MARIRSIHPGIWTDEAFVEMSRDARLFLIGIWNEADDCGLIEWRPTRLKMRLAPADQLDAEAIMEELVSFGFLVRFTRGGKEYAAVKNFRKFQRPKNPSAPILPLDDEIMAIVGLQGGAKSTPDLPQTFPDRAEKAEQMEDGGDKMEEKKEAATAASLAPAKRSFEIECRNLVGEEPVLLALDFHKIQTLVASGAVTEADVKDGIRSAMAKPDFRIRHWSQLEGWARGAAKARMETRAKASGSPIVVSMTPEQRSAALAKTGTRWVEYDTAEWTRVADLWKADKGTYPPHPSGGWYFPESYFARTEAAA